MEQKVSTNTRRSILESKSFSLKEEVAYFYLNNQIYGYLKEAEKLLLNIPNGTGLQYAVLSNGKRINRYLLPEIQRNIKEIEDRYKVLFEFLKEYLLKAVYRESMHSRKNSFVANVKAYLGVEGVFIKNLFSKGSVAEILEFLDTKAREFIDNEYFINGSAFGGENWQKIAQYAKELWSKDFSLNVTNMDLILQLEHNFGTVFDKDSRVEKSRYFEGRKFKDLLDTVFKSLNLKDLIESLRVKRYVNENEIREVLRRVDFLREASLKIEDFSNRQNIGVHGDSELSTKIQWLKSFE
jgi:hypothetical protein